MKIICDEKICVKCLACVTESEFGGVIYERGKIFFDETCPEDWENIFAICPVGAIKKSAAETTDNVSKYAAQSLFNGKFVVDATSV